MTYQIQKPKEGSRSMKIPTTSVFREYCKKSANRWGKGDAAAGIQKRPLSRWGKEAVDLYCDAHKKQTLINLVTGENNE